MNSAAHSCCSVDYIDLEPGCRIQSGGVTSGWLLPIAALLTIATLLSIAARLPVGVLLGVTALIVTSRLCRGVAGRRIGWWCRDQLHGVAPRHLGITVVTLSIS